MSSSKGLGTPHIYVVSNKRRKSYSLSPSVASSRSASVVDSPRKKRRVFVRSDDEVLSEHDTENRSTRRQALRYKSSSASVKETTAGSDSEDNKVDVVAGPSSHYDAPDPVIYDVLTDELAEDDNLQIIGETDPADLSTDSDDEDGDIPVRLLTDFTVYQMETRIVVPIAELLQIQFGASAIYGASGKVKPYVEDDDEEDDDENDFVDEDESLGKDDQIVKLSKILVFDIHHVSSRKKQLDSKMYLRTKYAWYILDSPSATYSTFFTGFWLQHRILHLVVTAAMANRRITMDSFVDSLEVTPTTPDAIAIAIKILGRELTEEDVESDDVKSYVLVTLDELREQSEIKIERVPLVRTLRGDTGAYIEDATSSRSVSRSVSPRKKASQPSVSTNPEREVLKHRNPTVVTPLVACIAKTLFERTLSVAGQLQKDDVEDDVASDVGIDYMHHDDPESMVWLEPTRVEGYYQSIDMDGVIYSVGETVMVIPGQDTNRTRSNNAIAKTSQTSNKLGNTMWFCRICYMYEEDGEKLFHGQWYTHGSKTLLQETAHPQSLFLMDTCEADIPLASIFQKCNVRELVHGEDEPTDESTTNENNFYHGLTWIEEHSSIVELSQADINSALAHCEDGKPCISCGLEQLEKARTKFRPLPPRGFFQRGDRYHIDDFVYVISARSNDMLYKIGQITKIKAMESPPKVVVRLFGRFDSVLRKMQKKGKSSKPLRFDNRRLFKTSEMIRVNADQIDGKCFVQHLTDADAADQWVRHDDHYYVNQWAESVSVGSVQDLQMLAPAEFKTCQTCRDDRVERLFTADKLLERHGPLRGLELYSGAGGLGTGLDMSGFVETRWAVEFSPSAALTYQANHPEATVYNQCSNLLLQHAIDSHDGKRCEPLHSLHDGKTPLPAMPRPGEVDFVYGGPPCQSFSGANHWKKANDIRSTLVCNMLSYVEFYRPSYFLLENVVGLLRYPLMGRMVGRAFVEGIRMGVVKFIVRSLTCLGYQVRFKILQAGQYGAPQGRQRVLFWGAKRGLPLPEFPMPTHGFPKGSMFHNLVTGAKISPPSRSKDPHNLHMYAPLHAVTVNDAIGDLPPFDWINPHQICKPSSEDKADTKHRVQELGIPQFSALTGNRGDTSETFPGFVESEPYAHKPLNRYQQALRAQVKSHCVNYQYTRKFGAGIIERVTSIPMRPDAYHDDLPRRLRMNPARKDGGPRNYDGLFGRIDGDGYFRTAMTTVAPNAKGGTLLHPSQKRIVTVQECARAQGFPDHYQFLSVNKISSKIVEDQHRQIGNAVPVPLALALGKSLGEVLLKTWEESDRAGSPEV